MWDPAYLFPIKRNFGPKLLSIFMKYRQVSMSAGHLRMTVLARYITGRG